MHPIFGNAPGKREGNKKKTIWKPFEHTARELREYGWRWDTTEHYHTIFPVTTIVPKNLFSISYQKKLRLRWNQKIVKNFRYTLNIKPRDSAWKGSCSLKVVEKTVITAFIGYTPDPAQDKVVSNPWYGTYFFLPKKGFGKIFRSSQIFILNKRLKNGPLRNDPLRYLLLQKLIA